MANNEAKLRMGIEGAEQVIREIEKVRKARADLSKEEANAARESERLEKKRIEKERQVVESVKGQIVDNLVRGLDSAISAATYFKKIDFKDATESAKHFDEAVTRLSLRGTENIGALAQRTTDVSNSIGVASDKVLGIATAFSDMTYSTGGSVDVVKAMGDAANKSGKQIEQMFPLAVTLGRSFGTSSKQIESGFQRIEDLSKKIGTTGGLRAFQDTIAALGPLMERTGIKTEESRDRMLAFIGTLGKGLAPGQATLIGAQALGSLQGMNPLALIRTLKENPYDEHGRINDPDKVYAKLKQQTIKRLGPKMAYYAYLNSFGPELGSELFNKNYDHLEETVAQSKAGKSQKKGGLLETKAGARLAYDVKHENRAREIIGNPLLAMQDEGKKQALTSIGGLDAQIFEDTAMGLLPSPMQRVAEISNFGKVAAKAGFNKYSSEIDWIANAGSKPPSKTASLVSAAISPIVGPVLGSETSVKLLEQLIQKMPSAKQFGDALVSSLKSAGNFVVKLPTPPPKTDDKNNQNKLPGAVNQG